MEDYLVTISSKSVDQKSINDHNFCSMSDSGISGNIYIVIYISQSIKHVRMTSGISTWVNPRWPPRWTPRQTLKKLP